MKKIVVIALAAISALFAFSLLGCSVSTSGSAEFGDGCKASYENNTITVTLPSNPTTGYNWTYTLDPTDGIKCTDDGYSEEATDEEVSGAGGTQTYGFEISEEGTYTVSLDYARSWESSDDDLHYYVTAEMDDSGNITSLEAGEK